MKAEEVCRAETGSIWELDEERSELFFRVVRGRAAGEIRGLRVPLGQGIAGSVALSAEAEVVNDVAADPRWRGDRQRRFHDPGDPRRAAGGARRRGRRPPAPEPGRQRPLHRGRPAPHAAVRRAILAHALQNARLYAAQRRQFFDMVTALAEALEKRDPYTGGHVRRVVAYSLLLGAEMGLGREELGRSGSPPPSTTSARSRCPTAS